MLYVSTMTIQLLVMISVRYHCAGHSTEEPPKRSWDADYIELKSDRNIVYGRLWHIRRETL